MNDDPIGQIAQVLALGGPVVWLLLALSIVALTITLFKAIELNLSGGGTQRVELALALWRDGAREKACAGLTTARRGLPRIVGIAMRCRADGAPDALLREELQRLATADMTKARSHLRTLEVIGQISPLLGLFGTVLGMIDAFRRMEQAGSSVDPAVLSGGIWLALLTTGVGLAVAIPTVLAHQWLERRADSHAHRIEDAITRVFTSELRPGAQGRSATDGERSDSVRLGEGSRAA